MTKLKIIKYPDPFLKQKCLPVTSYDKELKIFAEDMLTTMYRSKGIGLSAIQVGVLKIDSNRCFRRIKKTINICKPSHNAFEQ